nr:hypothetical protein CFP56_09493 [Quercus suber]
MNPDARDFGRYPHERGAADESDCRVCVQLDSPRAELHPQGRASSSGSSFNLKARASSSNVAFGGLIGSPRYIWRWRGWYMLPKFHLLLRLLNADAELALGFRGE